MERLRVINSGAGRHLLIIATVAILFGCLLAAQPVSAQGVAPTGAAPTSAAPAGPASAAASTVPAGVAPAPATPAPVTAVVRLFLHDILKFDAATGFTADVFLGFGCPTDCGDLGLVVDNGRATSREVLLDTPQRKAYRMELALTDQIDLHRYPFDVQKLTITLLSSRPGHEFQFAVDHAGTRVGNVRLQGWQVDPEWHAEALMAPADEFSGRPRPTYRFSIDVQRPYLAGFFKVLLPGLAILLIGSLGLVVGPDERMKRFDLFNAAFLGTVLFQLSLLSSLPPLSYLTFADRFLLINLLSIILGVVSSVMIIMAFKSGKKARAWAIHEWSMVVMPLVWLSSQSLNFLTVHMLDMTDPLLWAVAVGEAVLSAAILLWYSRRMHLKPRFRSAYRRTLEQTRSPKEALTLTLDIFASNPPLHVLSRQELDALRDIFEPLPDPAILADILQDAQSAKDSSALRDLSALRQFAAHLRGQRETPAPTDIHQEQHAA